jgi:hypothetical protein
VQANLPSSLQFPILHHVVTQPRRPSLEAAHMGPLNLGSQHSKRELNKPLFFIKYPEPDILF